MPRARPPFAIADRQIRPGHRAQVELPIAQLMSGTPVSLPVMVLHGTGEGPTAWVNAAIHGDELNGVEIIRTVLSTLDARTMAGTLLAVPIVNVHGFNNGDRYLPDRRDLNRSFPGSARGSLAARIAHLMMTEVVAACSVGIDLHTGSDHRTNLPQIRADLEDPKTRKLTQVFGPTVAIHSRTRDGSLRQAATDAGATVLLYEGGEAQRFDRLSIDAGVQGILRVLADLGMVKAELEPPQTTFWADSTRWMRATNSGILHLDVDLGETVENGQNLATIYNPFGRRLGRVRSRADGLVIGHTRNPLVNRGDAVVHVASEART